MLRLSRTEMLCLDAVVPFSCVRKDGTRVTVKHRVIGTEPFVSFVLAEKYISEAENTELRHKIASELIRLTTPQLEKIWDSITNE